MYREVPLVKCPCLVVPNLVDRLQHSRAETLECLLPQLAEDPPVRLRERAGHYAPPPGSWVEREVHVDWQVYCKGLASLPPTSFLTNLDSSTGTY